MTEVRPVDRLLTLDEYMEVLVSRQRAWLDAHPPRPEHPNFRRFPPLLEWFIRPEDEAMVQLPPDPEPKPKPAPKARTRQRRSAADIRAEIERVEARLATLGRPLSDDPAAARIGDARLLHSHHARMDRDLAQYTRLSDRLRRLRWQLADAEKREGADSPA